MRSKTSNVTLKIHHQDRNKQATAKVVYKDQIPICLERKVKEAIHVRQTQSVPRNQLILCQGASIVTINVYLSIRSKIYHSTNSLTKIPSRTSSNRTALSTLISRCKKTTITSQLKLARDCILLAVELIHNTVNSQKVQSQSRVIY